MVQSAPEGEPHFIITMSEHTALAGRFAKAYGNDRFESVEPREEVIYLVEHHDHGWADLDAEAPLDPGTRLPYDLIETPLDLIAPTSKRSPDFNIKRHAYCGLLSSMHSWGLYNGRYGLSDKVVILDMADEAQATLKPFLDGELARQKKLRKSSPGSRNRVWIEERHLFQNYKQLQFFDTLALYFNRVHYRVEELADLRGSFTSCSMGWELRSPSRLRALLVSLETNWRPHLPLGEEPVDGLVADPRRKALVEPPGRSTTPSSPGSPNHMCAIS